MNAFFTKVSCMCLFLSSFAFWGCEGGDDDGSRSKVAIQVSGLTSASQVDQVTVTVEPAGVSVDLTRNDAGFGKILLLPVGEQTFSVEAFSAGVAVGHGAATAIIESNRTALINIKVYADGQAQPDFGPSIRSVVISNSNPTIGEVVSMTVDAIDPNGEPLSYAWTGCGNGAFEAADQMTTNWASDVAGECNISIAVSSNGQTATAEQDVIVFPNGTIGGADVSAQFVEAPVVNSIYFGGANGSWRLDAGNPNATCPFGVSTSETLYFTVSYTGSSATLSDDCGGIIKSTYDNNNYFTTIDWQAPDASALCIITATAKNAGGNTSSLSMAIDVR